MIVVKNKADCCGCTACYSVCPKKAISMQQDQEGFLFNIITSTRKLAVGSGTVPIYA